MNSDPHINPLEQLLLSYAEEAALYRRRGQESAAVGLESRIQEIEEAIRATMEQKVTYEEAAARCGSTKGHLRDLTSSGKLTKHRGENGKPQLALRELPYKAGKVELAKVLGSIPEAASTVPGVRRIRRVG